jgi:hypothetical protein
MSENNKLKGVIVFFINLYPDLGQDVHATMNLVKDLHKPLVDSLNEDGRYLPLFVPTHKEATRIEKIDYDAPFPRYMAKSHDIMKVGLQDGIKKHKNNMFQQQNSVFKGVISIFVNFHPEMNLDIVDTINLIKSVNAESLTKIQEDGQYQLLLTPTTKEASRAEKVDWDMPFPRFVPKMQGKKNAVPKKVVAVVSEDDEDEDELETDEADDNKNLKNKEDE